MVTRLRVKMRVAAAIFVTSRPASAHDEKASKWDGTMQTKASPTLWLALTASFLLAACQMVGVAKPGQVSAEVEAVCRKQEAAWNRGDIEGFMSAGYMRSEKLSFYSGGNVEHGYDAMLAHYKKSYQADGKEMGQLTFENFDPLPLDNEHAVMRGRWQLHFKMAPP